MQSISSLADLKTVATENSDYQLHLSRNAGETLWKQGNRRTSIWNRRFTDWKYRTQTAVESNNATAKAFLELVREEHGHRIANALENDLSAHLSSWGSPLTGHRIVHLINKAQKMADLHRAEMKKAIVEIINEKLDIRIEYQGKSKSPYKAEGYFKENVQYLLDSELNSLVNKALDALKQNTSWSKSSCANLTQRCKQTIKDIADTTLKNDFKILAKPIVKGAFGFNSFSDDLFTITVRYPGVNEPYVRTYKQVEL